MNRPTKGYYRLKSGLCTLCFRILSCPYVSAEKKYAKLKVEWFDEKRGTAWSNGNGLPRHWKMTFDNCERFEKFFPEWGL